MAWFGVQPQDIVIGVGFGWFARFLYPPPHLQFSKKIFHSTLLYTMYKESIKFLISRGFKLLRLILVLVFHAKLTATYYNQGSLTCT